MDTTVLGCVMRIDIYVLKGEAQHLKGLFFFPPKVWKVNLFADDTFF